MTKIKIGFDIDGADAWDTLVYRNIIKEFAQNKTEVELFLITKNTDVSYVNSIASELGLDSNHIYQTTSDVAIITLLATYNILLYLTTDKVLIDLIYENIPLELKINNVTGCQTILVNSIPDSNKLQFKYITYLQFWLKEILKYSSDGKKEDC